MTQYRLRVRNNLINTSSVEKVDQFSSSNCNTAAAWTNIYTSSPIGSNYGSYASMRDVIVPNFRKRVLSGEVFFNPMEFCEQSLDIGIGDYQELESTTTSCSGYPTAYKQRRRTYLSGGLTLGRKIGGLSYMIKPDGQCLPPTWIISHDQVEHAIVEATTAALSDRGRSDANLWEAFAELDKSVNIVSDALDAMKKGLSLRSGLIRRAKAASNAYLLWRYGISPLYHDLQAALKGLEEAVGRVRKTSRGKVVDSSNKTISGFSSAWDFANYTGQHSYTESLNIRVSVLDEFEATAAFNAGFSLKDLATLPWELVPYSFVADWFTNIGDYIGALTPLVGVKLLGSSTVVERVQTVSYSATSVTGSSGYNVLTPCVPGITRVIRHKTRVPNHRVPGLVIRSNFGFSKLTRCLDSISLITQRIRK